MTWTDESVRAELHVIATEQLGWKGLPDGELSSTLDSAERLTLVVAIEDRFKVVFEPEDDEAADSIDAVVRIVLHRLEADNGP